MRGKVRACAILILMAGIAAALLARPGSANAVTEGSYPVGFIERMGIVYFTANDEVHGSELWRTDGTRAGTWMVRDINPGPLSSNPLTFEQLGGAVYFSAFAPDSGCTLWRTDGTDRGTVPVFSFPMSRCVLSLERVGGLLFLAADDGLRGVELWRSNGTASGTRMVRNIVTVSYDGGLTDAGSHPSEMTAIGNRLVFNVYDDDENPQLWTSDGSDRGTRMLLDGSAQEFDQRRRRFDSIDNIALFRLRRERDEIWRTDGTESGTFPIAEAWPRASGVFEGALYFSTVASPPTTFSLWRTPGTSSPPQLIVADATLYGGWMPNQLTVSGQLLYFTAATAPSGPKLWVTDGTPDGTRQVVDLNPGGPDRGHYDAQRLTDVNGRLFFLGNSDAGCGLWTTGGSAETTELVRSLHTKTAPCPTLLGLEDLLDFPPMVKVFGDRVIFEYDDGIHGIEPFISDGTSGGTHLLKDIAGFGCAGDCNAAGSVSVDELIQAVNITLGAAPVFECESIDEDGNRLVTIDEIIAAVSAALTGCT